MSWWQILLVLSIVVTLLGLIYSLQIGKTVERSGKVLSEGVSKQVSRHKILANPIFWSFIVFLVIIFIVTVYYIFRYPEGAY